MSEPIYIAQTFEPEHMKGKAALDWWRARGAEAIAKGATFPRYSWREDPPGLLIECWEQRPDDQGEQRWSLCSAG